MNIKSVVGVSLAVFAGAAGCDSSGLSAREGGDRTVSNYVLRMQEVPSFTPSGQVSQQPAVLTFPTTVAVAQMGEVSPPIEIVKALRSRPDLFARVEQIPGPMPTIDRNQYTGSTRSEYERTQETHENIDRIREVARGMGVSNLLLIGGTIDQSAENTAWSAANLTIIGAFITPGRQVVTETRATGVMVDLASNRVTLTASGQAKNDIGVAAASEGDARNNEMRHSRDKALSELGIDLVKQAETRRGGYVLMPTAPTAAR